MADPRVIPVEPRIHWRDIIDISNIKDRVLHDKVAGFLDFFEKSGFSYDVPDRSGATQTVTRTGQEILQGIKNSQEFFDRNPAMAGQAEKAVAMLGGSYVKGKLVIKDSDALGIPSHIVSIEQKLGPLGSADHGAVIELNKDFLKGIRYMGRDGRFYPMTVDADLAHQLMHAGRQSRSEFLPEEFQKAVTHALGGAPYLEGGVGVGYVPEGNGGYQTLYDKPLRHKTELTPGQPAKTDPADTGGTQKPVRQAAVSRPAV